MRTMKAPKLGIRTLTALLAFVAMTASSLLVSNRVSAQQGQASITLQNCDAQYCYTHNNTWTLSKKITGNTVADGAGNVSWTITATKDSSAAATFTVNGGLTVFNSGTAPATIGNIVVNLQKPNNPKKGSNASHVSIAADVATATNGDAATSANIVAAGSAENVATNAAWGTNNYTTGPGAKGTFVETAGSGPLVFTDASNNTLFSLVPQPVIPVGQSITLLYSATFATSILPAAGTSLRVETLVTFGNSGARGGGGATGDNIDINGNGSLDTDEAHCRTVPCRITLAPLPAAASECNGSVTVTDTGVTTTGTVTTSNAVGFDSFPAVISSSTSWNVSVDVNSGADGGTVCNMADLAGAACGGTLSVVVGYTPDNFVDITPDDGIDNPVNIGHQPIYATYECAAAASATASDCLDIGPPEGIEDGDYCSFSQGAFGGSGAPYNLLAANFASIYPSGVEVGIPGAGGFSMKFTSATAVQAYLPAGGGANKLTADLTNPMTSASGQFGGQVLALKLNIALSDASATSPGLGDLYYCEAGSSLSGMTVRQILAAAETALGGGALPAGYTYATLADLCANLDLSFDGKDATNPTCGVQSAWATSHLSRTACLP
ncbi:MAG TPA: hypothetical protein VGV87_20405 [Blastocatellia bacterium]|jgi:hypothetical protein|nr:hypothetical protein [Blastocatellia bacterium]